MRQPGYGSFRSAGPHRDGKRTFGRAAEPPTSAQWIIQQRFAFLFFHSFFWGGGRGPFPRQKTVPPVAQFRRANLGFGFRLAGLGGPAVPAARLGAAAAAAEDQGRRGGTPNAANWERGVVFFLFFFFFFRYQVQPVDSWRPLFCYFFLGRVPFFLKLNQPKKGCNLFFPWKSAGHLSFFRYQTLRSGSNEPLGNEHAATSAGDSKRSEC